MRGRTSRRSARSSGVRRPTTARRSADCAGSRARWAPSAIPSCCWSMSADWAPWTPSWPSVHAALREAEGLEEAWMGKGRGTVVRLAGILELLDWSATGSASSPGHIGRERIEGAAALWESYFRPHATSLFMRTMPTTTERSSASCGPLASQQRHDMCHARAGEAGRAEPHRQCQRYRSGALSTAHGEHRAADAGRLAGDRWPAHQHMGGQPGASPYGGTSGKGGKGGN